MEVDKGHNSYMNETNTKLSKLAGVGKETYRMGAKILNSENEKQIFVNVALEIPIL